MRQASSRNRLRVDGDSSLSGSVEILGAHGIRGEDVVLRICWKDEMKLRAAQEAQ